MNTVARRHIIFWIVFLCWDIFQVAVPMLLAEERPLNFAGIALYTGLMDMLLKVVLFYLLYFFVYKPAVNGVRSLSLTVTLTIAIVFALLFVQRLAMFYLVLSRIYGPSYLKQPVFRFYPMVVTLFDLLVPVCLLFIYELYTDARARKIKEVQLEKEKLQTELRFLKAQINPHFLFNVLGTIHALTRHQAPKAAEVTIRLSKIMRFMLYDAGTAHITLAEEIRILDDYIALEQVRFADKLDICFAKEVTDDTLLIAPLLLLPFVENAFKHGTAESQFSSAIRIKLCARGRHLHFEVHNSIETGAGTGKHNGIGLANSCRQLELLYPGHDLRIQSGEKTFSVYLNLQLNHP